MMNNPFYGWLIELSRYKNYQSCINLTDKWLEEKYDQELILRLFTFSLFSFKKGKVDDFINENIFYNDINLFTKIENKEFDLNSEKQKFEKTFDLLFSVKAESVFQKPGRGQQFLESYFEAIGIGLYNNINDYDNTTEDLEIIKSKIDSVEKQRVFTEAGTSSEARIKNVVPFGKSYFKK